MLPRRYALFALCFSFRAAGLAFIPGSVASGRRPSLRMCAAGGGSRQDRDHLERGGTTREAIVRRVGAAATGMLAVGVLPSSAARTRRELVRGMLHQCASGASRVGWVLTRCRQRALHLINSI